MLVSLVLQRQCYRKKGSLGIGRLTRNTSPEDYVEFGIEFNRLNILELILFYKIIFIFNTKTTDSSLILLLKQYLSYNILCYRRLGVNKKYRR